MLVPCINMDKTKKEVEDTLGMKELSLVCFLFDIL